MVGFAGRSNASQKLRLLLSMLVAFVTTSVLQVQGKGTRVGFYSYTCPRAESIVRSTVAAHFQSDPAIAPGLLRMHFHDCFVRGCDASILIDGDDTEKTIFNLTGYEVIDDAKAKLEKACPGIVSCADILALAARDAVVLANGASWAVPTGRRDGMVSLASDVANLPGVTESIDALKQKFADKGLSTLDLVTLLGAHTIGASSCEFFNYRLYNFTAAHGVDPVIDPTFVPRLQALCPLNDDDTTTSLVPLDTGSSDKFDASFFANLRNGRGILETDQKLWTDATTKPFVQRFLQGSYGPPQSNFSVMFGRSMVKLSNIDVKTGSTNGQIRKVCSAIN